MTSLIAFFIALTFGTANVDYNGTIDTNPQAQYTNDDGVGISGGGGQRTEDTSGNKGGN